MSSARDLGLAGPAKKYKDPELQQHDHRLLWLAFKTFNGWLISDPISEAKSPEQLRIELVDETKGWLTHTTHRFRRGKRLPWEFNNQLFPSLFDDGIGVLSESVSLKLPNGFIEWDLKNVRCHVTDPVAKLLLAVIWKQRDFSKVRLVLEGFRAARQHAQAQVVRDAHLTKDVSADHQPMKPETETVKGESAAVFVQFGRHLAEPKEEPIFDQHTSRASLLLQRLSDWNDFHTFENLFGVGSSSIPIGSAELTTTSQCNSYIKWWSNSVKPHLPPVGSPRRQHAMLLLDRLLFGLGQWARPILRNIKKPSKPPAKPDETDLPVRRHG